MTDSTGPVRGLWHAALLILGACLSLWLAVQLIQSVWLWLLVGALLVGAIAVLVALWRRRRSRW